MRRQLDIAYRGHVHNTGQQSGLAHMFRSEKTRLPTQGDGAHANVQRTSYGRFILGEGNHVSGIFTLARCRRAHNYARG